MRVCHEYAAEAAMKKTKRARWLGLSKIKIGVAEAVFNQANSCITMPASIAPDGRWTSFHSAASGGVIRLNQRAESCLKIGSSLGGAASLRFMQSAIVTLSSTVPVPTKSSNQIRKYQLRFWCASRGFVAG